MSKNFNLDLILAHFTSWIPYKSSYNECNGNFFDDYILTLLYHEDLEKPGGCGVVALERHETYLKFYENLIISLKRSIKLWNQPLNIDKLLGSEKMSNHLT